MEEKYSINEILNAVNEINEIKVNTQIKSKKRVDNDDIREYSFSNRDRAVAMRNVLISHLEKKVRFENRKRA